MPFFIFRLPHEGEREGGGEGGRVLERCVVSSYLSISTRKQLFPAGKKKGMRDYTNYEGPREVRFSSVPLSLTPYFVHYPPPSLPPLPQSDWLEKHGAPSEVNQLLLLLLLLEKPFLLCTHPPSLPPSLPSLPQSAGIVDFALDWLEKHGAPPEVNQLLGPTEYEEACSGNSS